MAGKIEKSKGKVKQVVGTLTDNKKLESEERLIAVLARQKRRLAVRRARSMQRPRRRNAGP